MQSRPESTTQQPKQEHIVMVRLSCGCHIPFMPDGALTPKRGDVLWCYQHTKNVTAKDTERRLL